MRILKLSAMDDEAVETSISDYEGFGDASLVESARAIRRTGLKNVLDAKGRNEGFRSGIDYLVCSMFPDLKGKCARFYADDGFRLDFVISAPFWRR